MSPDAVTKMMNKEEHTKELEQVSREIKGITIKEMAVKTTTKCPFIGAGTSIIVDN